MMIQFIRVPREGCDWDDVELLAPEEFKAACERGPEWYAGMPSPCALGWAYERPEYVVDGKRVTGYYGLIYDYRVARSLGGDGSKGWRTIGDWINPIYALNVLGTIISGAAARRRD